MLLIMLKFELYHTPRVEVLPFHYNRQTSFWFLFRYKSDVLVVICSDMKLLFDSCGCLWYIVLLCRCRSVSQTKQKQTKQNQTKTQTFSSRLLNIIMWQHTTAILTSSFQSVLNIMLSEVYHSINGLCSVLCVLYSNCDQREIRWPCFSVFGLHFLFFIFL